jgi:type II secretory pathway pseudopilin PulG
MDRPSRPAVRPSKLAAFTLVEVMVVVAIIAALIGILLPALSIIRRNADLVSSQSNMRTIGAFMTAYGLDNRDHVVPSRFDYRNAGGRALVRSASPAGTTPNTGPLLVGSWADIMWTVNKLGPAPAAVDELAPSPSWDYRYDSPDYWAYTNPDMPSSNVLRSKVDLTKPFSTDDASDARPFGDGASTRETGQPGYFAANDFFDSSPPAGSAPGTFGRWYTYAMIKYPGQSVYLVDSRAGETIPTPTFTGTGANPNAWVAGNDACEVDPAGPAEQPRDPHRAPGPAELSAERAPARAARTRACGSAWGRSLRALRSPPFIGHAKFWLRLAVHRDSR